MVVLVINRNYGWSLDICLVYVLRCDESWWLLDICQIILLLLWWIVSVVMNVFRYMPNHLPYIKHIAPSVPYHKHLLSDLLFHLNTFLPLVLLFLSSFTHSDMDYPYTSGSNFVDLLQSQQSVFGSSEVPIFGTQQILDAESPVVRRERMKLTPSDDILLISSWLNTRKDPVVGNEQRSSAFWKRIAAYFAASQKVTECERREPMHCKQRWQKINDVVCKLCGSYEAATREKTNRQNETDVLKKAHEIFYNNNKKKFNLEHVWMELRNDQK